MCSSGDAPATRAGLDVPEVFIHVRKSDHFTEFAIAFEATPTQCRFEVRAGRFPNAVTPAGADGPMKKQTQVSVVLAAATGVQARRRTQPGYQSRGESGRQRAATHR